MVCQPLPFEQNETKLFFRLEGEAAERHGAIGYLRVDFGKSGGKFLSAWFDTQRHLKTLDFDCEFQEVIDSLRNDGREPPFANRGSLQKFFFVQKGTCIFGPRPFDVSDGFKVQTLNFTYAFNCSPFRGNYDICVYPYDNRYLLSEQAGQHELPYKCFSLLPSSGGIIIITRGQSGYAPFDSPAAPHELRPMVNKMNKDMGVTRAQEQAMLCGSMFGWSVPGAKPWNYNENGKPRLPSQPKKKDPER